MGKTKQSQWSGDYNVTLFHFLLLCVCPLERKKGLRLAWGSCSNNNIITLRKQTANNKISSRFLVFQLWLHIKLFAFPCSASYSFLFYLLLHILIQETLRNNCLFMERFDKRKSWVCNAVRDKHLTQLLSGLFFNCWVLFQGLLKIFCHFKNRFL